jgi:hypothetical protein
VWAGPNAGALVAASVLNVSLLIRPETKGLKFFPRSRFLLQFRSLVMFWRMPHRRAAEQPGAAFSPTPECARSAVCHIADDRGEPVSSRDAAPVLDTCLQAGSQSTLRLQLPSMRVSSCSLAN